MKDFNEVIMQNPEPYNSIYEFISTQVIPKYPCLTHCYQSNFDVEGNPRVQYYIRYAANLSIEMENELFGNIFDDIMDFFNQCGLILNEELAVDFILTIDGDYVEKREL